jgi:hypothetical protein
MEAYVTKHNPSFKIIKIADDSMEEIKEVNTDEIPN